MGNIVSPTKIQLSVHICCHQNVKILGFVFDEETDLMCQRGYRMNYAHVKCLDCPETFRAEKKVSQLITNGVWTKIEDCTHETFRVDHFLVTSIDNSKITRATCNRCDKWFYVKSPDTLFPTWTRIQD